MLIELWKYLTVSAVFCLQTWHDRKKKFKLNEKDLFTTDDFFFNTFKIFPQARLQRIT